MGNNRLERILLINPGSPDFVQHKDNALPLSLLYLASILQVNNHEVRLIDMNNDPSVNLIDELSSFKPDLVGVTCLFSGRFKPAISISRKIKEYSPKTNIIMGGIHPTIFAREILKEYSCVDYICVGEGEKTLTDLVNGKSIEDIEGLGYRKSNNIILNEKKSFIENLNELPFPAYNLINLKDYYFDTSNWHNPKNLPINIPMPILSSRSCPNQCTFCSMFLLHGKKWRPRSAKKVVDEIEYLYKEYNHRYFSFMDDNFTFSKKRTLEITKGIMNRKLDIQFDTPNGLSIKTLDKEVMDNLVEAGLVRVCVAPESGSELIRNKLMKKNISTKKIYNFFNMIKDYKNLFVKAFFMIGYPQETKQTLSETYDMIKKISHSIDQISIFNLVPFPGTGIFEYCKNNNLITIPLENLHNSEIFSNYNESDIALIKPYKLEIEDLIKFREEAYKLIKPRKNV